MKRSALWALPFFLSACSSVSTPVLRHETGENIGAWNADVYGHYERTRTYPFAPGTTAIGTEQKSGIFQGSVGGVTAVGGLSSTLDLQAGAYFTANGGGWRGGFKRHLYGNGEWQIALMAGYSNFSGAGTISYLTPTFPVDVAETLQVYTVDLGFPVSYRFNESVAAYSGLTMFRSGIHGGAGDYGVSAVTWDLSSNLGLKFDFNQLVGTLEVAWVRLYDPLSDSIRYLPYVGASFGVRFGDAK